MGLGTTNYLWAPGCAFPARGGPPCTRTAGPNVGPKRPKTTRRGAWKLQNGRRRVLLSPLLDRLHLGNACPLGPTVGPIRPGSRPVQRGTPLRLFVLHLELQQFVLAVNQLQDGVLELTDFPDVDQSRGGRTVGEAGKGVDPKWEG